MFDPPEFGLAHAGEYVRNFQAGRIRDPLIEINTRPSHLASSRRAVVDLPQPINPVRHTSFGGRFSLIIAFEAHFAA